MVIEFKPGKWFLSGKHGKLKQEKIGLLILILNLASVFSAIAQTWNDVGGGVVNEGGPTVVTRIKPCYGKLFVSGSFTRAGNIPAATCAQWNQLRWDSMGKGSTFAGGPDDFVEYNGYVCTGGDFQSMGNVPGTRYLAKWDGQRWSSLGSENIDHFVYSLATYHNQLYAGGDFTKIAGISASRIARYDGNQWLALGKGLGGFGKVYCMAVYKDQLYVGGDFSSADGKPTHDIARWNGTSWDSVGGGFNGPPLAMLVDSVNNILYVGGYFTTVNRTTTVLNIAKWDGTSWSVVTTNLPSQVNALALYHGALYAACTKGVYCSENNWQLVAGTADFPVITMAVYKDELYLGGGGGFINGQGSYSIIRYSNPVGVKEFKEEKLKISVFPNPANKQLTIRIENASEKICNLQLMDLTGRIVLDETITTEKVIDAHKYDKGIYTVSVCEMEGRCSTEKIIIQ